jgi:alkanesulfonate monooxygenase SsuD/methylene tetrahydromethanopterin reductase-like flavin-dependent oxidoreductase (luciferase family)
MQFGLFGSAQAKRGGPDVDSGAGFREFVDNNVEAEALGYHSTFLVEHHFTGSRAAGRARASPQSYSPAASSTEGGKGRRVAPCGACLSDHLLAGLSRLMASACV